MDAKKALAIFIALILLGEALYLIFINNQRVNIGNNNEEQRELFTAIIKAKIVKLDRITTKNSDLANALSFCNQNKIMDDYIISCQEQGNLSSILKNFDGFNSTTFRYKINTEKVITKVSQGNFTQDMDITLPYYIELNGTIELEGTATIINDSISSISINSIYTKRDLINESAKVLESKIINYLYSIPFDYRNIIPKNNESNINIRNVVYTNMTNIEKPDFVSFVGEGYIIVNDAVNAEEVKKYYKDAVMPNIIYETKEKINNNYNFSYSILYNLTLNTSIGLINTSYNSNKTINEGEYLNISIDLIKSGDLIISKKLTIIG
ncbi:MAG: hypothetical protein QXS91_01350 [Candidatus Anstonellales archaeon]